MKYLFTAILAGCCTIPDPVVKVVDNPEKDRYIAKIEAEASDGASALSVASKSIEGKGKSLVELTQVRLAGIKEPSVAKVAEYQKAMLDPSLLAKERERAAKVEAEADRLQQEAERLDEENAGLREALASAQREKDWGELRTKFIGIAGAFAFVGAGLFVLSTFLGGVGRFAGFVMISLSVFFGGAPFVIRSVVESPWFHMATAALCLLAMAWGGYAYWKSHRAVKSRLTEPQNTTA
jgi:hypothetical protein